MKRRVATGLAGVAVFSLFFVPDTRWPWLLLPLGVALVAFAVYVATRGDEVAADTVRLVARKPIEAGDLTRLWNQERIHQRFAVPPVLRDAERECPACPHQRVAHSGYGCDYCDCRVNIIDLIPLPVWEVPFR